MATLCRPTVGAAAESAKRRFVCAPSDRPDNCDHVWRPSLQRARRAVDELDQEARRLPTRETPAIIKLFEIARRFDDELRAVIPARRGQPRHFDTDLLIEALHLRGFTDSSIDKIIGAKSPRYTELRRHNGGIRRRTKAPKPAPRLGDRSTT